MAKQRTKKQKIRATYHYAFPAERSFSGLNTQNEGIGRKATKTDILALYQYDPMFTRRDLSRTFLITGLMIALEIGIYILF